MRVQSHRRWNAWLNYCLPLSAACLGFAVLTRFMYIPNFAIVVSGVAVAGVLAAMALAFRTRVSSFAGAARLDWAENLKERLSTVVEVSEKQCSGEIVEALISDAAAAARDALPEKSLVFHAPISLPITLAFTIIALALILAPRSFGTSQAGLSEEARIALEESVRFQSIAGLLEEGGADSTFVEQVRKVGGDLKRGDVGSAGLGLAAVRVAAEKQLADVRGRDSLLRQMQDSAVLKKLAEMISSTVPDDAGAQADAILDGDTTPIAQAMKGIADVLEKDSELLKRLEDVIKTLELKDREAFLEAMKELGNETRRLPGAEELEMTLARTNATAGRLGVGEVAPGAQLAGAGGSSASYSAGDAAIEEAMDREEVPERFRGLVKLYFARSANYREK